MSDSIGLISKLRKTLGKMEVVLGTITEAIAWTDKLGRIQWSNASFDRLISEQRLKLLGRPLIDLLPLQQHGQPLVASVHPVQIALHSQSKGSGHYELLQAERLLTIEVSWDYVQFQQEASVVLVVRDITERQQAEIALQQYREQLEYLVNERTAELTLSNEQLQREIRERQQVEEERTRLLACEQMARIEAEANEQRFRFLTEVMPQQVWTARPDGQLDYINQRVLEYFNCSVDQALGWAWQAFIHPDDLLRCLQLWQRSLQSGTPYEVEFRLLQVQDGFYRWHLGRALPLRDREDNIISWFGTNTDIHDQKQAESALRESEARFRSLVDNIPGAVYRCSNTPSWTMEFISPAIADICGYPAEEFIDDRVRTFSSVIHPDDQEMVWQTVAKGIQAKQPYIIDYRIVHVDGSVKWVYEKGQGIFDETGSLLCLDGVIFDITERKRVEDAMAGQNQALEMIATNATLPEILEFVCQFVEEQFGDALCSILLLEPNGKTLRHVSAPSLPITYSQAIDGVKIGPNAGSWGAAAYLEAPVVVSDIATDPLWANWRDLALSYNLRACWAVPILNSNNQVLGTLAIYYRTPRHPDAHSWRLIKISSGLLGIAIERQRAEDALRESEERFRELTENIQQVFWMTEPNKERAIYISPAYEKVWGQSLESVYQSPTAWLDSIYAEDRDRVLAALPTQSKGEYDEEYRLVRPDGSIRWIRDRAFPIRSLSGKVSRVAGIAEDITERKQAQEELIKALDKEKELRELKSRFVSMASHEFRTPLATILASSDLLKHFGHKLSEDNKRERLNKIQIEVQNITRLLDDVLMIGQAEAGKLVFNPTLFNLEKFCRNVLAETELAINKSHQFIFKYQGDCTRTVLDENLLQRMLPNLLSNAVKYSASGTTISLHVTCQSTQVVLQLQDQGIGIPEADLEHLFESFYRAKNVGKVAGTGLGLAIVKNAVELHSGSITVASEVGVGTTFTICLPSAHLIYKDRFDD